MNQLATLSTLTLPAPIIAAGDRARFRYIEFFTAQIRNPNTRRAYARPIPQFSPNARLDTMRERTGKTGVESVRRAAAKQGK